MKTFSRNTGLKSVSTKVISTLHCELSGMPAYVMRTAYGIPNGNMLLTRKLF